MAKIFINELRVETIIGTLPHERVQKQPLIISLEIMVAIQQAANSDDLQHTCDYDALTQRIVEFVAASNFKLLETLGEKLAQLILTEFKVDWLQLKIVKPTALKLTSQVGVIIERHGIQTHQAS